jgi:hypothetical protein
MKQAHYLTISRTVARESNCDMRTEPSKISSRYNTRSDSRQERWVRQCDGYRRRAQHPLLVGRPIDGSPNRCRLTKVAHKTDVADLRTLRICCQQGPRPDGVAPAICAVPGSPYPSFSAINSGGQPRDAARPVPIRKFGIRFDYSFQRRRLSW